MKISLNWLTDYVELSMSAKELAERLTCAGLNCEQIIETDSDVVLDLEVTSNRPDCNGHLGVAREVAAITGARFTPPGIGELATSGKVENLARVDVLEPELCPRYTARVIRNVKVGPSPRWMVERLEAVGLRSINNVVDATNYVLMEYSQPLHSFDYDKLSEHRIVVRRAEEGEVMVSIDGTTCHLDEQMLVIADAQKAVAIAGVMGGLSTEVTESTTNVLIESAVFDAMVTRRTSRKLQLMSESNFRFERGVDPVGVNAASLRACGLILDLAGGELAGGVIDVWAKPFEPVEVSLRPERTNLLLGVDIPAGKQEAILRGLELSPRIEDGRIVCTIPPHRPDLSREVDLVEEVARMEGYDNIPVQDRVTHALRDAGGVQRTRRRTCDALRAVGFDEAITPGFIDDAEAAMFGCREAVHVDPLVRRSNNALRATLLASLLRVCKTNQDAGNGPVNLFELASVFRPPAEGQTLPSEHWEMAMVTSRNLRELRGAMEAVVAYVAPDGRLEVRPAEADGLCPTASAEVLLDGEAIGHIGIVAENVRDHYALEHAPAAATVRFDALDRHAGAKRAYRPVPRFPAVRRDLSLIVDDEVTWSRLIEVIAAVDQPMRVGVDYVTTYRGKPIAEGRKSITVTLTYRWDQGTLRSEQVDEQVDAVLSATAEKLGAEVRK